VEKEFDKTKHFLPDFTLVHRPAVLNGLRDHTFSMYAFGGGEGCKFEVHFAYSRGGGVKGKIKIVNFIFTDVLDRLGKLCVHTKWMIPYTKYTLEAPDVLLALANMVG
jgi:hypothetical protein